MKNKYVNRVFCGIFSGVVLLLLLACEKNETAANKKSDLKFDNVVLIVIDTLRADHLPFYGYHKETAPFLNELSSRSVVFEKAFSSSSTTAPASASLFTSQYPSQHGVITGFIAFQRHIEEKAAIELNRIPDSLITIGEEFKAAGYRTYCVSDNLNISTEMGFDKGFDKFRTYRYKGAPALNATLREWESDIKGEGKYFLYMHYIDPHKPYNSRAPWYKHAKGSRAKTVNAYDSEINYVDRHIQEMFDVFGWGKNTLVVIVADHGEEFWEHGNDGHGKTLYREVTHIPLMFFHPDLESQRVSEHVSIIDVLPTVADLSGLPQRSNWSGRSLVPQLQGEDGEQRILFSELLRRPEHPRSAMRSVITPKWHLIETISESGEVVEKELYDLGSDFSQKQDVGPSNLAVVADLQKVLKEAAASTVDRSDESVEVQISDETLEQLKTLGYVN